MTLRIVLVTTLTCSLAVFPALAQNCNKNPLNGQPPGSGASGKAGPAGADDSVSISPVATATGTAGANGGCGASGMKNVAGGNGAPGAKGGTGTAKAIQGAGNNRAAATGGAGGSGGAGGNSTNKPWGKGANGNDGGDGIADAASTGGNASAQAKGGNGGDGGNSVNLNGLNGNTAGNGGDGGDARADAAAGVNSAFSTAKAQGGDGGAGGSAGSAGNSGGNGGNGGTARATAINGLVSIAQATGGNGRSGGSGGDTVAVGEKGGNGGDGGKGGSANASASGRSLAVATATGGTGASGGAGGSSPQKADKGKNGTPGKDGAATATATAAGGALPAASFANAKGGGISGDATATSTATSNIAALAQAKALAGSKFGAKGTATATATATSPGLSVSFSSAQGNKGTANTRSVTVGGVKVAQLSTNANAQVDNDAVAALSRSVIGQPAPNRDVLDSTDAGVSAVGDPLMSDVLEFSAGDPNVIAGLQLFNPNTVVLGLADMAGGHPTEGEAQSGGPDLFSSSAKFDFDLGTLDGEVKVGLLDPIASGPSFDSLVFQIFENGVLKENVDFTSVAAANSFFHDEVLDLGPLIAGGGPSGLNLEFAFDLTASLPGARYQEDFLVASVGNTAMVPEPGYLPLVAILLIAFGWCRRRNRRSILSPA
jgi:hypothetical protein